MHDATVNISLDKPAMMSAHTGYADKQRIFVASHAELFLVQDEQTAIPRLLGSRRAHAAAS
jgi:hypothetical protein